MKIKLFISVHLSLIFGLLSSQIPQGFNYQAVARDASGHSIINTPMPVRITIQSDSSGGTIFWQELHSAVTTNNYGLINIILGKGVKQTGDATTFSAIDWSVTPKFIKTEIDYFGWLTMGVSRIWAVPYALYSESVTGNIDANNNVITNVALPLSSTDAANKAYVDALSDRIEILEGTKVKDGEGNLYHVIKIGNQKWMAENLKTTKYRNGDPIGTTSPSTKDISGETNPAYQWTYDGNENNAGTYGRLYTWYAVNDTRNICPVDWHVPTEGDWLVLEAFLGGSSVAGGKLKETGTVLWLEPNTGATNQSGFKARPGGYRDHSMSAFYNLGMGTYFWSSTEYDSSGSWGRMLTYDLAELLPYGFNKKAGCSVRCLRD